MPHLVVMERLAARVVRADEPGRQAGHLPLRPSSLRRRGRQESRGEHQMDRLPGHEDEAPGPLRGHVALDEGHGGGQADAPHHQHHAVHVIAQATVQRRGEGARHLYNVTEGGRGGGQRLERRSVVIDCSATTIACIIIIIFIIMILFSMVLVLVRVLTSSRVV